MAKEPITILLVEDNPDHAELIIRELKKNNGLLNKIYLARDGQEALDFLFRKGEYKDPKKAPRPGLILLDLKLPKVDGSVVLKKIKSDRNLRLVPVVTLTTSSEEEDIARCYRNGTSSYIPKPVKFEEFVKVVREIKLYWILTNVGSRIQ